MAEIAKWLRVRHRVCIWGKVTDAVTQKPIAGAEVTLTEMPAKFRKTLERLAQYDSQKWATKVQRPDKTRSRADGLFYFLDLPDGKYEVRAVLPNCGKRYGEARLETKVISGEQKKSGIETLRNMWVNLKLRPTVLKGRITDAASKAAVVMAEVRVKGSGERTFSDKDGHFTLGPIEPSKAQRTLQAFAQGYAAKQKEGVIVAEPGQVIELGDFGLVGRHG